MSMVDGDAHRCRAYQFIFSARVRNTYEPLDLSPSLRIPIAVTVAVAVLNVALAAIGGLRLG
ncbi:MAG TPA: hypothetical protein VF241_09930 [Propionibacteriaceae bacterium]